MILCAGAVDADVGRSWLLLVAGGGGLEVLGCVTLGLEALGLEAIGLEALGLEAQGRFWMLLADTGCSWLILVNKSRKMLGDITILRKQVHIYESMKIE